MVVENEDLPCILGLGALHLYSAQVVAQGIHTADAPRKAHAQQSVQRGSAARHVIEEVETGLPVVALGKQTQCGQELRAQTSCLGIGQMQPTVDESELGTEGWSCLIFGRKRRLFQTVYLRHTAKQSEHLARCATKGEEFVTRLNGSESFNPYLVYVALHGHAAPQHTFESIFVALEQLLQVEIEAYSLVYQQQGEEQISHPQLHLVEAHFVLCRLDTGLPPGHIGSSGHPLSVPQRLGDLHL